MAIHHSGVATHGHYVVTPLHPRRDKEQRNMLSIYAVLVMKGLLQGVGIIDMGQVRVREG